MGCGTYKFTVDSGHDADKGDNRPDTRNLVPICEKPPKISGAPDWSGYIDGTIKADNVFCAMDKLDNKMDENSRPIEHDKLADFPFEASISWIKGCKSEALDPRNPVSDWTCKELFTEAKFCKLLVPSSSPFNLWNGTRWDCLY